LVDRCIRSNPIWLEFQTSSVVLSDFWTEKPFHFAVYEASDEDYGRLMIVVLGVAPEGQWNILALRSADCHLVEVETLFEDETLRTRVARSLSMNSLEVVAE
jgi:hypothetical protein